jgi:hypothetical protein
MSKTLRDMVPGDYIAGTCGHYDEPTIEKVVKVGKIHIFTERSRYQLDSGREVGASGFYTLHMAPATKADFDAVAKAKAIRAFASAFQKFKWKRLPTERLAELTVEMRGDTMPDAAGRE